MEAPSVSWTDEMTDLVELSLQWVIGKIVEDDMASLAGLGLLNKDEKVTFSLTVEDDNEMFNVAKEEVVKSGVTHFAMIGAGELVIEGEDMNVFVLYAQDPSDKVVRRYLCAFNFEEDEDGEGCISLSEWEEIEPMDESWLAS